MFHALIVFMKIGHKLEQHINKTSTTTIAPGKKETHTCAGTPREKALTAF